VQKKMVDPKAKGLGYGLGEGFELRQLWMGQGAGGPGGPARPCNRIIGNDCPSATETSP
jgi:hypothetical protein